MTPAQLRARLEADLKEAMPLDRPSTLENVQDVADFAAKKTCLLTDAPGELVNQAGEVTNVRQCAALLAECLRYLPREENTPLPTDPNQALSVRDVARILGVSTATVYKRCSQGEIPHNQIGRRITFTQLQIAEYQQQVGY